MTNNCKHSVDSFFVWGHTNPKKPSKSQIAKYKLYQCGNCHKWFLFLVTKKEKNRNGRRNNQLFGELIKEIREYIVEEEK